jgi:hypothetical protein
MQKTLERKADIIALICGALLGLVILITYIVGIDTIASDLNTALNPGKAIPNEPLYNLDAASKLDLKGLTPAR